MNSESLDIKDVPEFIDIDFRNLFFFPSQVPQMILNDWIKKSNGANCNILVTQPRRISAIALAKRVAKERGERV